MDRPRVNLDDRAVRRVVLLAEKETVNFPTSSGASLPCSEDPELWFSEDPYLLERAAKICQGCPILDPCLSWGLRHEKWGVFGGMTPDQRRSVREKFNIRFFEPPTRYRRRNPTPQENAS